MEQAHPLLSFYVFFVVQNLAKPEAELSCCWAGSLMDTHSLEAMMEQGRPFLSCLPTFWFFWTTEQSISYKFSAAKAGKLRVYTELSCCRAGSLMDTNSLEAMMEQGRPARRRPAPVNGNSNSRPAVNGRPGNGILDSHVISTHGEL